MNAMSTTAINSLRVAARNSDAGTRQELHDKVSSLVGEVFLGTMLREFRATQDTSNPLTGGRTGAIHTRKLDQELISRLAASQRFDIGKVVADRWIGSPTDNGAAADE